jgi:hypothetical protein
VAPYQTADKISFMLELHILTYDIKTHTWLSALGTLFSTAVVPVAARLRELKVCDLETLPYYLPAFT